MADEDRPLVDQPGDQSGEFGDARYFGPFYTGPSYPDYPAPAGVQPLQPLPPERPPAPKSRARTGPALLIIAALLALVIGGAAGFGGARLAGRTATPDLPSSTNAQPSEPPMTTAPTPVEPSSDSTAPPDPNRPRQIDTVTVARNVLPGTVMIRAGGSGSTGSTGSGFVLDASGRILTNNHVVARTADGGRITVTFADGRRSVASLVGRSPSYDVAVIKVAPGRRLKPLPIGNSEASRVGEPVVAVGSPLGLPGTVTQGIISAKNRPVVVETGNGADAPSAYINGIQTDAPINPGNSGGPLIDAGGRVIGVNSAILTLSGSEVPSGNIGLGFAIPSKQAVQIARLLIRDGKATYPIIGADVGTETNGGVELSAVESNGPADRAGLRVGDLVTSVDRLPVSSQEELIVAIRTHRPGESVTLAYERGTTRGRAVVTLGSKEG